MPTAWLAATAWAFWLGLVTSVSPCPLAVNIAAGSRLGRMSAARSATGAVPFWQVR